MFRFSSAVPMRFKLPSHGARHAVTLLCYYVFKMGYYVFKITMFISRKSILTKMTMTTLTTARHAVTRVVTQRCCVRKGTLEQILSHYSNLQ